MASSVLDNPHSAILEINDIIVTIGNAAKEDAEHDALLGYEYDGPKEDHQAICWVPAVPGCQFFVHVGYDGDSLPYPNAGLRALVFIDGVGAVAGTFIKPQDIIKRIEQRARGKPITTGEMEMTGKELKDNYIRPFCFSQRQTVETGSDIPPENIKYFGEIHVEVYWAIELPPVEKVPKLEEDSDEEDFKILSKPVDERLKHVQHRFAASLGDPVIDEDSDSRGKANTRPANEGEEFWFTFLYRDVEWLRTDGIVPKHKE